MLKHIILSCCGLLALSQATLIAGKKKSEIDKEKNRINALLSPEKIAKKLADACRENRINIIRELAPLVDLKNVTIGKKKRSLLHIAAKYDAWPIVQSLIARGINPNAADKLGYTPLMCASQHNNILSTALLLARGANPREKSPDGTTPLLLSNMNQKIIKTFRKSIARKEKECIVCLESKEPQDHRMLSVSCLHTICGDCKYAMIGKKMLSCPWCRQDMDKIDRAWKPKNKIKSFIQPNPY